MGSPVIDVAVAVVRDGSGRVLLAERTPRQVAAGFWELPGGKIDPGESAAAAAARELGEEIGLHATALRPWLNYVHAFPTKRVRLHLFHIEAWRGTPQGREGQRLAWVDPGAPAVAPLLPSNRRAMFALGLPRLLARIDDHDPTRAIAAAAAARDQGAGLILLSAPHCASGQQASLVHRTIAAVAGVRVLLQGTALEARRAGAHGAVASAAILRRCATRPAVPLWGAACGSADDLALAAHLGADFAIADAAQRTGGQPSGPTVFRADDTAAPLPLFTAADITTREPSRFLGTTGVRR
ncbi:NUDIX domain-containing protein [Bradyrhizobium sp. STM 3809]|uniref:NUDIX domain-containing protein n=1 Tax=Bradyrhizobium sp. STM 3809 TaxID=551936 RepID=UPI00024070A8|nr:NUDIX domain-containing protein [Bradyrhizobium sp. STM 3809]CCD98818.1 conserved hypothetical protein [Bradyrhizobium sp. STM 3809]